MDIVDIKVKIENRIINLTNPDKLLWPEAGITKKHYVEAMTILAPFMIKYSKNRLLTAIRYPHGIGGKSFFQKEKPDNTPEWIKTVKFNDKNYIVLNSAATIIWLCTQAVLEFHTSFNIYNNLDHPSHLVFDLDPDDNQDFRDVAEIALSIYETLESLGIKGFVKTSGASGLQIYIPTASKYDYDTARKLNEFFAQYFVQKLNKKLTIERLKKNREGKTYFDYLQMWYGKTIIAPYSPRAVMSAAVSTPLEWEELNWARPELFTLINIAARLEQKGDLFEASFHCENNEQLDAILKKLNAIDH